MDEKIIIKSERYNVKKFFTIMVIIGAVLSLTAFLIVFATNMSYYDECKATYSKHQKSGVCYTQSGRENDSCWDCTQIEAHPTKIGFALQPHSSEFDFIACLIPVTALALIGGLAYLWLHSYEMTVTDKRIFGKVAWGKRVDLPVDSVSAVATSSMKGIAVATSSGKITFKLIKNVDSIHKEVSRLIIDRQNKIKKDSPVIKQEIAPSNADELKKYKDLLDSGIITQEEFDAKKKQLLGL